MNKTALITGYTGQDGTFLTGQLLEMGYRVIALCRRVSTEPPHRKRGFDFSGHIQTGQLVLEQGDLLSVSSLIRIIDKYRPGEVYNLAAQSHVATSFNQPEFTIQADFMGVVNLITALEAVTNVQHPTDPAGYRYQWRMYQASTSEMFGDITAVNLSPELKLNEKQCLNPNSPYAIAKTAAHLYCRMKRAQGAFIACGILFNHESEFRGGDFVTQKIARAVAALPDDLNAYIKAGRQLPMLHLGNLESKRDWGYAGDYTRAMHMMLQHDKADDFVIGTGVTRSVREFVDAAAATLGHKVEWIEGQNPGAAAGMIKGQQFVVVDPEFYRPNDVTYLRADASKAADELGWFPVTPFESMVQKMVAEAKGAQS